MGKPQLDLPVPLRAKPVADANADNLLSQIAGDQIDRFLAEPGKPDAANAVDEKAIDAAGLGASDAGPGPSQPASLTPRVARRETAVSTFVADRGPNLNDKLDDILDAGQVQAAKEENSTAAAAGALEGDAVLTGELDQVFERMTVSSNPPPPGSIDLLKILDPIVAGDAATARALTPPDAANAENATSLDQRSPIHARILEWISTPMARLPSPIRDAAGKVGILTLINAIAILLYILFFRRK